MTPVVFVGSANLALVLLEKKYILCIRKMKWLRTRYGLYAPLDDRDRKHRPVLNR